MAAEVANEPGGVIGEQRGEPGSLVHRQRIKQRFPDLLVGGAEQCLVGLVRHVVDPPSQELASLPRVRFPQPVPVLELDHLPTIRPELRLELCGANPRYDSVERLAVEIDDPEDIAELSSKRLGQCLPDVALVEFRVSEERDEPSAGRRPEVRLDVAVGKGAEEGRSGPEAHRPGREVDGKRILRPARIALQPAEVAQPRQIRAVQAAEQVLERMHHRRRVRLHRHAVTRIHVG